MLIVLQLPFQYLTVVFGQSVVSV